MDSARSLLVDRLREILAEIMPRTGIASRLGPDDSLRAAGMDSMRMVMLISALQEQFNVIVEEEDLRDDNFASLSALASFVAAKIRS